MLPSSRSTPIILLASVLKPVDDTRMFEKFGRTLAGAGYRVLVAGRSAPPSAAVAGIEQHPIFSAHRLSADRLRAQLRYWRLLTSRTTTPDLVVVHAPELLPLTLLWQLLGPGRRFLYDVRENYALNIQTQQVYSGALKRTLAGAVSFVERLAARRAAAVILAERSYAEELDFLLKQRTIVLENKFVPPGAAPVSTMAYPVTLPPKSQPLRLLFTGTLSTLTGVFDAIDLAQQLRGHWPQLRLTIIGYCQKPNELQRLQQLAVAHGAWLTLLGGAEPVPHEAIMAAIEEHHLGLLLYQPHPSSWRCIPTKLYEYLGSGLPVLVAPNPPWIAEVQRHKAGDVLHLDPSAWQAVEELAQQLVKGEYYPNGPVKEALWASEAPRLLQLITAALTPGPPATAAPGSTL